MSDKSRQKATVFVGGLNNDVNEQTLHDAFIPFGEIVEVSMPKPELYVEQLWESSSSFKACFLQRY